MSKVSTDLQINFSTQAGDEPFALVVDDGVGAEPVKVYPYAAIGEWIDHIYTISIPRGIRVWRIGKKRVRLYCSEAIAANVQVKVYRSTPQATVTCLGRRFEPIIETLTWNSSRVSRLQYPYDNPDVTILDHTWFIDADGNDLPIPIRVPNTPEFMSEQEVTGTLVVRYSPGFTLYEIPYDIGETFVSADRFREITDAWWKGNIEDAIPPGVEVLAIAPGLSARLSFRRDYNPSRQQSIVSDPLPDPIIVQDEDGNAFVTNEDSIDRDCWEKCKEMLFPNENVTTFERIKAVKDCVASNKNPSYQYVEQSRQTKTDRISSSDNPELYIDVDLATQIVLRLQRADGCPCNDPNAPTGSPEIVLRFKD